MFSIDNFYNYNLYHKLVFGWFLNVIIFHETKSNSLLMFHIS